MSKIKDYSDLQQSKKLAAILPLESADMYWDYDVQKHEHYPMVMDDQFDDTCIYAWSLAALRNLLPPAIKPNKDSYLFLFESHNTFDKSWVYRYYNEDDTSYLYYKNTNEVDACYEMIIKLNELNLL